MGVVVETSAWGSRLELSDRGLRQRGPADPFVEALERTANQKDRLFLATRALRRDPDCIEANLVVAAACEDREMRLAYLNIAVEAGDGLWRLVGRGCSISGVEGARPWLQAIMALGEALAEAGDTASAAECFERLVELDPADVLQANVARTRLAGPAPIGMVR